jgi:hypothetical protein
MEKDLKDTVIKEGFFSYVFNFDEETKSNLLNIVQFAVVALVPIVLLVKGLQKFVPPADDEKSSIEIIFEVVIELIVTFVTSFYILRIIRFIPTYSEHKYPDVHVVEFILPVLIIILSYQDRLGGKVNILVERFHDLWEGKTKKQKKSNKSVKVSQPLAENTPSHTNMLGTTSISALPVQHISHQQQQPDEELQAPMAANEFFGSQSFGSGF